MAAIPNHSLYADQDQNPDPDQDKTGIKEESQNLNFVDQDDYKTEIKEDHQDPDFICSDTINDEIETDPNPPGTSDEQKLSRTKGPEHHHCQQY
ncbi:hypothetical protein Q5P01_000243 [Channa striata]|uniref:Uncharacterized protein n=1 Tax=Channa striata TaxID=64152 RepID=A0AA88IIK5_CHASR|nr:hypothetical protein Q5P01_000243 [Channa striata]